MKKLLDWRVLFGFLVLFTIFIVSLTLLGINRQRNRVHDVIKELIGSTKAIDSTNHLTQATIDSLSNQLSHLSSQVTLLEAQKDSIMRANGYPKKAVPSTTSSTRAGSSAPLRKPVFTVIDKRGRTIGKDGIAADSIKGMRVLAGSGFSIKSMEVTLARGTSGVIKTRGYGNYDFGGLGGSTAVGDRLIISVLKVSRVTDQGTETNVDVGTVLLTVPLRAALQPYFYVESVVGQRIGPEGIDQKDANQLKSIRVSGGSGYQITNMIIIVRRGNSTIIEKTFPNGYPEIDKWAGQLLAGDKINIDIKKVTVGTAAGPNKPVDVGNLVLTIPVH